MGFATTSPPGYNLEANQRSADAVAADQAKFNEERDFRRNAVPKDTPARAVTETLLAAYRKRAQKKHGLGSSLGNGGEAGGLGNSGSAANSEPGDANPNGSTGDTSFT